MAGAKTILLVFVWLVGIAVCGSWFYLVATRPPKTADIANASESVAPLSGSTLAALQNLRSPIEIRFYFPQAPGSAPENLIALGRRADQLLAEYERAGEGKIRVVRLHPETDAAAETSAKADGIRMFSSANGEPFYLGLAVANGNQKEIIAQLSPEWEGALEFDVSRALVRLDSVRPAANPVLHSSADEAEQAEKSVLANPQLASASFEEGTKILREQALLEFADVVGESIVMEKELRDLLEDARQHKTDSEQQTRLKALRELQAQQTARINEISRRMQNEIAALERIKASAR